MSHSNAFLPFALPDLDESEFQEIRESLESGWVTTGPKTRRFEAEFAARVGARHAVAVNSCTAAMHLALEALGLQPGDMVITTPYTFAATAEVVRYFGAVPVFVDVEPDGLNIDPVLLGETVRDLCGGGPAARHRLPPGVLRAIGGARPPKCILPVHIAGLPAEMDTVDALAAEHHLAVLEDAAHALPACYKGHSIGATLPLSGIRNPSFEFRNGGSRTRNVICFSFYATKTITTGEGGMICTDDEELADRCRVMALHGISKDAWKRYSAEGSWYYEIVAPGYKYNMTDIAAGMGLAQLGKAQRMWQRRVEIAARYDAAFGGVPALQLPFNRDDCQHAWHLYMLRLHLDRLRIDRAQVMQELRKRNIGASVHFIPLHLHPYYRETYGYQPEDFPVACREYQREVSLPIYSKMSDRDVQDVAGAVLDIVATYGC